MGVNFPIYLDFYFLGCSYFLDYLVVVFVGFGDLLVGIDYCC